MRRAAKIDGHHRQIVAGLRRIGARVQSLAGLGGGCPDLLVSFRGAYYLLEIKMPDGSLTLAQVKWLARWRGPVHLVRTLDDALLVIGARKAA